MLFPELDFMRMLPGQGKRDTGSLTRKCTLGWTHEAILNRNATELAQKAEVAVLKQQEKEKKDRERIEKEETAGKKKADKATRKAAQEAAHEADIWHCKNLTCDHVGPNVPGAWHQCDGYGSTKMQGCKVFVCSDKESCLGALNVHESNCIYMPGRLETYRASQIEATLEQQEPSKEPSHPRSRHKKQKKIGL